VNIVCPLKINIESGILINLSKVNRTISSLIKEIKEVQLNEKSYE